MAKFNDSSRYARKAIFRAALLATACGFPFAQLREAFGSNVALGLYSTGVDNAGNNLARGASEIHYTIASSPYGSPLAFVADTGAPVGTAWVNNGANYQWISDRPDAGSGSPAGNYIYTTTFTIPTTVDLSTVALSGTYSADDIASFTVNGMASGDATAGFNVYTPVSVDYTKLKYGVNTLSFTVTNAGGAAGMQTNLSATYIASSSDRVLWTNGVGGNFTSPTNWTNNAAPTSGATVVFALSSAYSVSFSSSTPGLGELDVLNDFVALNLLGNSIQVAGNVSVGQNNHDAGSLTMEDGSASFGNVSLGGATSSGTLLIDQVATVSAGVTRLSSSTSTLTAEGVFSATDIHVDAGSVVVANTGSISFNNFYQNGGSVAFHSAMNLNGYYELDSGSFSVGSMVIGANGYFNQTGGTLSNSNIAISGKMSVSGTLDLSTNTVSLNSGSLTIGAFTDGAFSWRAGELTVNDPGFYLDQIVSGTFAIDGTKVLLANDLSTADVTLLIVNGGQVSVATNLNIGFYPNGGSTILVEGTGLETPTLLQAGNITLGIAAQSGLVPGGNGHLVITSGGTVSTNNLSITNGDIVLQGGTLSVGAVSSNFAANLDWNSGTLSLGMPFTTDAGGLLGVSPVIGSGKTLSLRSTSTVTAGTTFSIAGGLSASSLNVNGTLINAGGTIFIGSAVMNTGGNYSQASGTFSGIDFDASNAASFSLSGGTFTVGMLEPQSRIFNPPANSDFYVNSGVGALSGPTLILESALFPASFSRNIVVGSAGGIGTLTATGSTISTTAGILVFGDDRSFSGSTDFGPGVGVGNITSGSTVSIFGNTYIGSQGGIGNLTIGIDSTLNVGAYLLVGYDVRTVGSTAYSGVGTLNVFGDSQITSGNAMVGAKGGIGKVNVDGNWTNAGTIYLGQDQSGAGGTGSISFGVGSLTTNSFVIGSGGCFTGTGTLSAVTINNGGNFSQTGALSETGSFINTGTVLLSGNQSWDSGTTFTNNAGTATFSSDAGSASASPLSIVVNGGLVNFASSQHLNSLSVQSGTVSVLAGVMKTNGLIFGGTMNNWSGTLDLTSNKLVVEDATTHANTLAIIRNEVLFGRSHGGGITSSSLGANKVVVVSDNGVVDGSTPGLSSFGGTVVDAGSVLVVATYVGDANLDGVVDINDLTTVANHWQESVLDWRQGDFDGSGFVDIADLTAVAIHWQDGVVSGGGSGETFGEAVATLPGFRGVVAVPEPGALGFLGLGVVGMVGRRRGNRRGSSEL